MANGGFNVYSYKQIDGWNLETTGGLESLTDLIPIQMNDESYFFAPSSLYTKLLTIIKHSKV